MIGAAFSSFGLSSALADGFLVKAAWN